MTLSIVMITMNSADVVEGELKSIEGLWDEFLVGDGGSTDGTLAIAKKYGGTVVAQKKDVPLGERKQELVEKAKGDWILVLDADERVSEELAQEIRRIIRGSSTALGTAVAAYRIPYQNYVFGRPVYFGGEKYAKVRLFRKGFARISPDPLHEEVIVKDRKVGELKGVIHHYSYRTPWQLFAKFTRYAWTAANMHEIASPRQPAGSRNDIFRKLFFYGPHMVWARFIKEKGYKDGWRGLVLALAFGYMEGLTYWLSKKTGDILLLVGLLLLHFWILGKTKFIVYEEMFSYGWFIKNGLIPYRDIAVMYPPGVYYLLYFVYSVFGFTFPTLQGTVYTLVGLTDVLLFAIARTWFGSRLITIIILLFYIMWHVILEGKILWPETMLMPAMLLALYFFWKSKNEDKRAPLIFSGIFFSFALLLKQPSMYPLAATVLFALFHGRQSLIHKVISIGNLLLVPVVSAIGVALIFLRQGLLGNLLYWIWYVPTSVYARHGYYLLRPRRPDLYAILPILLIVLIGLILSVRIRHASRLRLLVLWAIAVGLFAYPRWAKFHLLPFLAISSLIFGEIILHIHKWRIKYLVKAIILVVFLVTTFTYTAREMYRHFTEKNPAIVQYSPQHYALLAEKIKNVTGNGRVYSFENVHLVYFMIGSVPTVLPWLSVSPILEMMPELQSKLVSELEDDRVDYLVYFPYGNESLADDRSIPPVFKQAVERRYFLYTKETFPEPFMIYKKQP